MDAIPSGPFCLSAPRWAAQFFGKPLPSGFRPGSFGGRQPRAGRDLTLRAGTGSPAPLPFPPPWRATWRRAEGGQPHAAQFHRLLDHRHKLWCDVIDRHERVHLALAGRHALQIAAAGGIGIGGGHLRRKIRKPGDAAVAPAEHVVAEKLVEAGIDEEIGPHRLHGLDEGARVRHVAHRVLDAGDVPMAQRQLAHERRAQAVTGARREVVEHHGPVHALGQRIVKVQDGALRQVEVIGRNHHGRVRARVDRVVRERNARFQIHLVRAGIHRDAVVDPADGVAQELPLFLGGNGEEFADAPQQQDAVHPVLNQIVVDPAVRLHVDMAVLVHGRDGRCDPFRVHAFSPFPAPSS